MAGVRLTDEERRDLIRWLDLVIASGYALEPVHRVNQSSSEEQARDESDIKKLRALRRKLEMKDGPSKSKKEPEPPPVPKTPAPPRRQREEWEKKGFKKFKAQWKADCSYCNNPIEKEAELFWRREIDFTKTTLHPDCFPHWNLEEYQRKLAEDRSFPCCGGTDETPKEHTQDCESHPPKCVLCKLKQSTQTTAIDGAYARVCDSCVKPL